MVKHTIDSSHDESNLRGIRGACEVSVNLLLFGLVQGYETVQDVVARGRIIGTTFKDNRSVMVCKRVRGRRHKPS
jgi:hypothetical protein